MRRFGCRPRQLLRLGFLLASIHFVASVAVLLSAFGAGFRGFDAGEPPSFLSSFSDAALDVLWFPLLTCCEHVLGRAFPGLLGYLPIAVNSSLWAIVAVGVVAACQVVARSRDHH